MRLVIGCPLAILFRLHARLLACCSRVQAEAAYVTCEIMDLLDRLSRILVNYPAGLYREASLALVCRLLLYINDVVSLLPDESCTCKLYADDLKLGYVQHYDYMILYCKIS